LKSARAGLNNFPAIWKCLRIARILGGEQDGPDRGRAHSLSLVPNFNARHRAGVFFRLFAAPAEAGARDALAGGRARDKTTRK
jgi:hypothetical protein